MRFLALALEVCLLPAISHFISIFFVSYFAENLLNLAEK
jgi:hypothetical protein